MKRAHCHLPLYPVNNLLFLYLLAVISLLGGWGIAGAAPTSFTLQVEDSQGNPVQGFRWLLEEDRTHAVTPGAHTADTLSVKFHTSHMPVVKQGESAGNSAVIDGVDDTKRYFVSVLPFNGYSNGAAQVSFAATSTPQVTAVVAQHPIPTAQLSVFAYEDTYPITNLPDLPQEKGLPGFSVLVFDTAGQYGIAGGQVLQDAFGNPLGTEYNPDGTVATMGNGVILTGADGVAFVKNLAPGKYDIQLVPPAGQDWHQTHTIEGGKALPAWVQPNEPLYFTQFGPPGYHVFIGFTKSFNCFDAAANNPVGYCNSAPPAGTSSITGRVTNLHNSRPPNFTFHSGHPVPACWIGLNDATTGTGRGVYARPCNADSTFSINNVPPGNYQLVVWDESLNLIITNLDVAVLPGTATVALGDIPVFSWFHHMEHSVFFDRDQDGFRDCVTADCNDPTQDDVPLGADQAAINLRFRDGRVYQNMPIDIFGDAPLDEVFPFFHWLVAEVDFAKLKATGVTVTVDNGGAVAPGEVLTPQPQTCTQGDVDAGFCSAAQLGQPLINPHTGDNLSRTETGPVLLEAFQGFISQVNRFEWGKSNYGPDENGGISGIVFYAITRAENDPRFAVGEEWEPGIPRIQVNLYRDSNLDGQLDDLTGDGLVTPADVDNYPLGWSEGGVMGAEDIDRNGNGQFELGDAVRITHTDSWDDNVPTGCQGDVFSIDGIAIDCYDGLRNFNQVRPGVFDGGYAFGPGTPGDPNDPPLPPDTYIVEVSVPSGYELVREEDKNVDFGDAYSPSPLLLPNVCVGDAHTVPAYLTMQTDSNGVPYPGIAPADLIAAPFAGTARPLCDRKQVQLSQGQNAAADFFLFTETPKAAMVVGIILNNFSNEFNPNTPNYAEKYAPSWMPVSFRDWTGKEVVRTYADEWGKFNALLPSTHSVHIPMPSGVSPSMMTACLNDPGPIPNPAYDPATNPGVPPTIIDPNYDRRFSGLCYTLQYMPGATTYLDTPVVPIAAFTGSSNPVDCTQPTDSPLIHSVSGPNGIGAYVEPGETLTIVAAGDQEVPNPAYDPVSAPNRTIVRHYGFGNAPGTVALGGTPLTNVIWSDGIITATVPAGAVTGQLQLTRADGVSAPGAATVTVGPLPAGISMHQVFPSNVLGATPIQDAIDLAGPNDLILVAPGTYNEQVIMYKPVRLQGSGAYSTVINAIKMPDSKLQQWREKLYTLYQAGAFDLLPDQLPLIDPASNVPLVLPNGEGAGITVLGKNSGAKSLRFRSVEPARIDGLTISGADHGGGIFLNGYARYLEISNNRIVGNHGVFAGGIRVGHADLTTQVGTVYTDAMNQQLTVHHNEIIMNGSLSGPGGIALYTGADRYTVSANYICGNIAQGIGGGGIGHLGLSNRGNISDNTIRFNQAYNPGKAISGGGIYVAGQATLGGANAVTPGSGKVTIDSNLIQGNQSGSGEGGGIRTDRVNGEDVALNPTAPRSWYKIKMFNNMVVNNVAALAGGGISIRDTLRAIILNNTVAHNDSTATSGEAFLPGQPNQSIPQPAGVVSNAHSLALNALIPATANFDGYRDFSKPWLANNIIWQNRSFYWSVQGDANIPGVTHFGLVPDVAAGAPPVFDDLAVIGVVGSLDPRHSVLTDPTGYHSSNIAADPGFITPYFNGDRAQSIAQPFAISNMLTQPAFDEGGNFIDINFGPLTPTGDYHLQPASPARDAGKTKPTLQFIELGADIDGEFRPSGTSTDMGADEVLP